MADITIFPCILLYHNIDKNTVSRLNTVILPNPSLNYINKVYHECRVDFPHVLFTALGGL